MHQKKIFIDGSAGTTGLRIKERLSKRDDLVLLNIPEALRKDNETRKAAMNNADIVFLCLPDEAAKEAVRLVENENTVIIDTSTAHRVSDGWIYGFPEIAGHREQIKRAKRIANPGCHASGFIALVAPLREMGLLSPNVRLSCFSLTGYSGGGKKMIAEYREWGDLEHNHETVMKEIQTSDGHTHLEAPRLYGLSQSHKHLAEMMKECALSHAPIFCPIVAPYYSGMEVTVPLFSEDIDPNLFKICHADPDKGLLNAVKTAYKNYYQCSNLMHFDENADEGGFLSAGTFSMRDDMEISVFGNDERMTLVARFDNLGKGASGAAIQNMNIVLGLNEKTGLNI